MNSSESFIRALQGKPKTLTAARAYCRCGRIVRTLEPQPTRLADENNRRVVMVMGPSSLSCLVGKTGYEMAVEIGHRHEYIAHKVELGYKFYLVVFDRPKCGLKLATWRNCIEIIASAYPQAAEMIRRALPHLKKTDYSVYEDMAGFSFEAVDLNGADDERYMTLERLLVSDGSPLAVRRFLYHVTRLTELYEGNGYTFTHDGKRGVREYIMLNRPLSELQGMALMPLDVTLPREL